MELERKTNRKLALICKRCQQYKKNTILDFFDIKFR